MGWLQQHLETFVRLYLGFVPTEPLHYFSAQELTVIKNAWRSVKQHAKGRDLLLAGRDVFVFEVLARRENYPTSFIPECSRAAVRNINVDKERTFLFDTGFAGSIPAALGLKDFKLLSFAGSRWNREDKTQVFPRLSRSRGLALKIERTPKYWETGHSNPEGGVIQNYSGKEEFERAACLTIALYTSSAPRFFDRPRVLREVL